MTSFNEGPFNQGPFCEMVIKATTICLLCYDLQCSFKKKLVAQCGQP